MSTIISNAAMSIHDEGTILASFDHLQQVVMKYYYAYQHVALPSNTVTLIFLAKFAMEPTASIFLYLLWAKLIVIAVLLTYLHFFRGQALIFFMNLGVSPARYYGTIVSLDLVFFSLMMLSIVAINSFAQ